MKFGLWAASPLLLLATSAFADQPAPSPAAAHYEIKFMTGMIDHHAMAVMMSDMCLKKATHADLLSLCESINTTQSQEIETMQSWLQSWYGISYQPDIQMTGEMKRLASMSGAVFEIEFLQMMIRHHFKAVVESRTCEKRAYHPELINLCHNIGSSQTQEIQTMQTWLCSWYSICNWGPKP